MVKGISRRVIVVRSPDPRLFEQAIFFLREDVMDREGMSAEQIVAQAREAAESCMRRSTGWKRWQSRLRPRRGLLWFLAGAACAVLVSWQFFG